MNIQREPHSKAAMRRFAAAAYTEAAGQAVRIPSTPSHAGGEGGWLDARQRLSQPPSGAVCLIGLKEGSFRSELW
jgi:hypothetical protein